MVPSRIRLCFLLLFCLYEMTLASAHARESRAAGTLGVPHRRRFVVAVRRIEAGQVIEETDVRLASSRRGGPNDLERLCSRDDARGAISMTPISKGGELHMTLLWRPLPGNCSIGVVRLPGCPGLKPHVAGLRVATWVDSSRRRQVARGLKALVGKLLPIEFLRAPDTSLEIVGILRDVDVEAGTIDFVCRRAAAVAIAAFWDPDQWRVKLVLADGSLSVELPSSQDETDFSDQERLASALDALRMIDLADVLPAHEFEATFFSDPRWGQPIVRRSEGSAGTGVSSGE